MSEYGLGLNISSMSHSDTWVVWMPTVTTNGGTVTSSSIGAYLVLSPKLIYVRIGIHTTATTGAPNGLVFTLPFSNVDRSIVTPDGFSKLNWILHGIRQNTTTNAVNAIFAYHSTADNLVTAYNSDGTQAVDFPYAYHITGYYGTI